MMVSRCRVWVKLLVMLFFLENCGSERCWKEERFALFQLKRFFSNWVDGDENLDCCLWKRTECNTNTGRVIELHLSFARDLKLGEWYLNASLFSPFQELEILDLSFNKIAGFVENEGIERLSRLRNLKILNLSGNSFSSFSILTALDIGGGLCELVHLQVLYLYDNDMRGILPWCLSNMTSLQELDASTNCLEGHIPVEIGAYLPSLKYLNISKNAFNGSIPSSFGDMNSLEYLDMSHNQLTGEIPENLAKGCFSLEILALSNNSLQGQIFSKNFNMTNLLRLQLDGNNFTGTIPESLSNCFFLAGLYLSGNHLSGGIPRWLGNAIYLEDIIIPNNHLEGPIPTEFCQLDFLKVLDLSNNSISGSLPSCFSPISIEQVHLSRNKIEGQIKDVLRSSSFMVTLDLSYNRLHGRIPNWINSLSQLNYLILAYNNFEGKVPVKLCRLNKLRLIDLSHNSLSGQIPSCLDNTALNEGHQNAITPSPNPRFGPVSFGNTGPSMRKEETIPFTTKTVTYYYKGRILTNMSGIDLSSNKLTGEIPPQIGYLTRIRALNFSHNNLTGSIPETFKNLKQIESFDLSYNNLYGKIPSQLVELNTLAVFSVAHNNLSGKTPEWTAQFATFNESSYDGNPFLCGLPLPQSCDDQSGSTPSMPKASTSDEKDDNLIDMNSFYITFAASYTVVILEIAVILYVNPFWRRRWFYLVETWMTSCYYFVVDHLIPRQLWKYV